MTNEFKSDQFVISTGSGTAKWIDEHYDGNDGFGEGVFQKVSGELEGAQFKEQDVYLIDTSHADFASFKTGFVDDYTKWRDEPGTDRKEMPKEADMLTLLENLEHPEKYAVHLPAGNDMADWLKGLFKEDTLKDEGEYELSTQENKHREIVLTFNRNDITESQMGQLREYVAQMPNDEKDTLQNYGPDYLNLYRFAKEQIEKPAVDDGEQSLVERMWGDDPGLGADALGNLGTDDEVVHDEAFLRQGNDEAEAADIGDLVGITGGSSTVDIGETVNIIKLKIHKDGIDSSYKTGDTKKIGNKEVGIIHYEKVDEYYKFVTSNLPGIIRRVIEPLNIESTYIININVSVDKKGNTEVAVELVASSKGAPPAEKNFVLIRIEGDIESRIDFPIARDADKKFQPYVLRWEKLRLTLKDK